MLSASPLVSSLAPPTAARASSAAAAPRDEPPEADAFSKALGDAANDTPEAAEAATDADQAGAESDMQTEEPCVPSEVCGLLADIQSRHARGAPTAAAWGGDDALTSDGPTASRGSGKLALSDNGTATIGANSVAAATAHATRGEKTPGDRHTLPPTPPAKAEAQADGMPTAPPVREAPPRAAEPTPLPIVISPLPAATGTAAAHAHEPVRAEATLAAPLSSPDFAPQLATTLTTFVRDGISHAQLHLNPAEMGPVSVQIQLDGQNAQVLLTAHQADTRQALEQSLPLLAGSLREAGLTLAGGGVFEQRQQGDTPRGDQRAPGRADTRAALPPLPAPGLVTQRRGVVDLIA